MLKYGVLFKLRDRAGAARPAGLRLAGDAVAGRLRRIATVADAHHVPAAPERCGVLSPQKTGESP